MRSWSGRPRTRTPQPLPRTTGADMQPLHEPSDYTHLDDPAFLDERARVREQLEHEPESTIGRAELARAYDAMTEEFLRRARIAWTAAT
jgi:hypothetical protein